MDLTKYTKVEHPDGRVEFIPIKEKELGELSLRERYYVVRENGEPYGHLLCRSDSNDTGFLAFGNCYPTKELAEKASKIMRRNNLITRACLLVDPDFEPNWHDAGYKYFVEMSHICGTWVVDCCSRLESARPVVSSEGKAKQVCALLTKWGVK